MRRARTLITVLPLVALALIGHAEAGTKAASGKRAPVDGTFGLILRDDRGNAIDTFRGIVTKDMVGARDTTIRLSLTAAELDTLRQMVISFHLFEYPDTLRGTDAMQPISWTDLRIRDGKREKEFSWSSDFHPSNVSSADWERFVAFHGTILRMVREKAEYKALPRPRGGYY